MKITKEQIKQIIEEESAAVINERLDEGSFQSWKDVGQIVDTDGKSPPRSWLAGKTPVESYSWAQIAPYQPVNWIMPKPPGLVGRMLGKDSDWDNSARKLVNQAEKYIAAAKTVLEKFKNVEPPSGHGQDYSRWSIDMDRQRVDPQRIMRSWAQLSDIYFQRQTSNKANKLFAEIKSTIKPMLEEFKTVAASLKKIDKEIRTRRAGQAIAGAANLGYRRGSKFGFTRHQTGLEENKINKADLQKIIKEMIQKDQSILLASPEKVKNEKE